MVWIPCPYLGAHVELPEERRQHILRDHPDLLPAHEAELIETISDPDLVAHKRPMRDEIALVRWFPGLYRGRYVAAIVVTDPPTSGGTLRYWIVTAHIARRLGSWRILWERAAQR